jgi:hypothetical protein
MEQAGAVIEYVRPVGQATRAPPKLSSRPTLACCVSPPGRRVDRTAAVIYNLPITEGQHLPCRFGESLVS